MIEIIDVSKRFRIWEDRSRDLKETTINFLRGKKRSFRDVWALRGIHLSIGEGETVAFIGQNGSGKSTLLKLLGGIYAPDEGRIVTRGKISTLLELGIGFHPDLTGEENIYLNGAMLGFGRKEMEQRFDEIVSFSEIGDFVYSPIRTYSSGMLMRLGFSIATCVDPDILLVDEILAVGDEAFQEKCFERMKRFKEAKKTIVLVSHSMEMVEEFCDRAILLREGSVMHDGAPGETIERYHALTSVKKERLSKVSHEKEAETPAAADLQPADPRAETEAGPGPFPSDTPHDGGSLPAKEQEPAVLGEKEFDPGQMRIVEVKDSFFFAGHLFQKAFGTPPPAEPMNFVALYMDAADPLVLHVIGCIHVGHSEEPDIREIGFVGGLCVDPRFQEREIRKSLLASVDTLIQEKKAFFVYTNDPELALECGYEAFPDLYLAVKWRDPLPSDEKARLIKAAVSVGPF